MRNFNTPFSERKPIGLRFTKPSLAQSQYKDDADINRLVQRFMRGDMSVLVGTGQYTDVSDAPESMHDLMTRRSNANTAWQALPEQVRASYGTPEKFLEAYDSFVASQSETKSETKSETVTPEGASAV